MSAASALNLVPSLNVTSSRSESVYALPSDEMAQDLANQGLQRPLLVEIDKIIERDAADPGCRYLRRQKPAACRQDGQETFRDVRQ